MNQVIAERIAMWGAPATRRKDGLQRFVAGWAALGITLSGATQLRTSGLPIGLSELMLGGWICFVVFLLLRGVPFTAGRVFFGLAGYWLLAWVLLGLGAMIAIQARKTSTEAAHDAVAFLYLTVLTPMLALGLQDQGTGDYHWRLARMFFLFNAGSAGLLLAIAHVTPELGPVGFWFGPRLRGWALNPNQLAIAMAAMPFLGWLLLRRTSSLFGKIVCALGIAASIAAGIGTQSDGLRAAWLAGFGAVSALLIWRVTVRGRSRWLFISHAIIPATIVIIGLFYGNALIQQLSRVGEGVYDEGSQGDIRLTAWRHGIEAISQSPLVGFGPGAYSGLLGPFENFEAHSSLIDWGMSTGLIGIILHLLLWGWCLWRALRSRSPAFFGMMVSIIMAVTFGYLLRHPIVLDHSAARAHSEGTAAGSESPAGCFASAGRRQQPAWRRAACRSIGESEATRTAAPAGAADWPRSPDRRGRTWDRSSWSVVATD